MHKEFRLLLSQPTEKRFALPIAAAQLLEFPSGPSDEREVQHIPNAMQLRPSKMLVVVEPTGDHWVQDFGNINDIASSPGLNIPVPDCRTDPLQGLPADRRIEASKRPTAL